MDQDIYRAEGDLWPTIKTLELPFNITDIEGNSKVIVLKVWVVAASVPLLVGKDTHWDLDIVTYTCKSKCELGEEDNRRFYKLKNTKGGHWLESFDKSSNRLQLGNSQLVTVPQSSNRAGEAESVANVLITR